MQQMTNIIKTRRLFFALWPSYQIRQSIIESFSRLSLRTKGRITSSTNLHITLHYLGPVTDDIQECMHAAARSIKSAPFELQLDCYGYFPRAKVFWLGCRENPTELSHLYNQLGVAIEACGYHFEARAYAPHITLMRKCAKPDLNLADFSIPWRVDDFVLVESITTASGVHYQVIDKYALS